MSIFKHLFNKSEPQCPRCLGKGFVDWDDIRRLNKVLKWVPAPCAYCNGSGKTTKEMLANVPVDMTYLTIDLPESEIEKIKNGDIETLEKGKQKELFLENLIKYVQDHYLNKNMTAEDIAELYLRTESENAQFSIERQNLIQYIRQIIELKKSDLN
ncbi:hypothetical protein [Flavobacterium defluvii]|uniref:Uncharacterized protein n=1 Tax=Flavobacterium defluvii TaxID=370979 RepID=A0A1M5EBY4_9FLAO|nr:hypothetical protein [Flavobacterium defluvii]SHF76783.1 hypothetical protein SAMN05443663_10191 [Flavobacterium defluvii]